MLAAVKKPLISGLSVLMITLIFVTYQNCSKPLDEIGLNSNLSENGTCQISANPSSVYVNEGSITVSYSFLAGYKLRVVLVQNSTGDFTENIYTQNGSVSASYTSSAQKGTYTAHGIVEDASGATAGTCQDTFTVNVRSTGGNNPPQPTATYSWVTGNWGSCSVTACGQTGTQIRAVSCKRDDGTAVADSYCSGTKPASSKSCSTAACGSCALPWGGTIAHNATVTAYLAASVPYGQTCSSQSRKCNNGTLSGTYTKKTCTVSAGASCSLAGVTVPHGSSKTFYSATTVACGKTCASVSQSRTCTNGSLNGSSSYNKASCTPPTGCGGGGGPGGPGGGCKVVQQGSSQSVVCNPK